MSRQAVVGVCKVPDVIDKDVNPGHIGPDHVLLVLGRIYIPPCGHTEDVQKTGNAVHDIVPAAILPYAFRGEPPLVPAHHCALEVGDTCNEDVDCNDDEREGLEPVLCTDTPFVLNHHEADTAGRCCIQFGIVEPALHIDVSLVFKPAGKLIEEDKAQKDHDQHSPL